MNDLDQMQDYEDEAHLDKTTPGVEYFVNFVVGVDENDEIIYETDKQIAKRMIDNCVLETNSDELLSSLAFFRHWLEGRDGWITTRNLR